MQQLLETVTIPKQGIDPTDPIQIAGNPPRTICPRKRGYKHMPIAVVHDYRLTDETGIDIQGDLTGIVDYVRNAPPTVYVVTAAAWFLALLDDDFKISVPTTVTESKSGKTEVWGWQYGLSRTHVKRDEGETSSTHVTRFGIRSPNTRNQRMNQCWDMTTFSPSPLNKFLNGPVTHESLMTFAQDVRTWAEEQNLELKRSLSGYAAQFHRDARFYPERRRKVPTATNERARAYLPGNHVRLFIDPHTPQAYNVTSYDQRSAHHRIVQEVTLPDSNTLHARGYFHKPLDATKYWTVRGDPIYSRATRATGLLCVDLSSRATTEGEFRLPKQDYNGTRRVFIWTNEIEFIESTGSKIEGVIAGWTSTSADTGLARYGEFAQQQLAEATPERKQWLKPLLHATYGLLAANPRPITIGHRLAIGGKPGSMILGAREFPAHTHDLKGKLATTNVIQRGIIESETQLRSLRLAQNLTDRGCAVTGIFTDGVHVVGNPVPVDDARWKQSQLTHVVYIDNVSYYSDQKPCLPGRLPAQRRRIIDDVRAMLARLAREHESR